MSMNEDITVQKLTKAQKKKLKRAKAKAKAKIRETIDMQVEKSFEATNDDPLDDLNAPMPTPSQENETSVSVEIETPVLDEVMIPTLTKAQRKRLKKKQRSQFTANQDTTKTKIKIKTKRAYPADSEESSEKRVTFGENRALPYKLSVKRLRASAKKSLGGKSTKLEGLLKSTQ